YIFLSAALVSYTGVLLLALGTVVGQLAMSVVLDALWPASATPGLWQEVLTVSIAFLSVAVAAIPWRRMR
ncbi:MAG: EamA-like transporter family protein, partial [Microbacterium sp.]|nr:EamA-like transporter family protein [Microbacterium sp.]